jgi:S-adenosylmethionine:tRNA ribosyltransferase-isomerase
MLPMRVDELNFDLPAELIAQTPASHRAGSRLLHYRRTDRSVAHRTFSDLPSLLRPGDLLVFNDARVIPARFMLVKSSGGKVEGLFLREVGRGRWSVLLRNLGRYAGPLQFANAPEVGARVVGAGAGGNYEIEVASEQGAIEFLARVGRMPLPPYIKRDREHDERDALDQERYQTVYARQSGSVAAPTAGLHFTPGIMAALDAGGVERTFLTLHVGLGTFKPITSETLEGHVMHSESYAIGAAAAEALNRAKRERRRIIAVGTTAARVLESQGAEEPFEAKSGETGIFIYPPYAWKHVEGMVTNFHLPRSTLIALVAAMVGIEEQRRIYRIAIEERYRFFSYGDAMVVE